MRDAFGGIHFALNTLETTNGFHLPYVSPLMHSQENCSLSDRRLLLTPPYRSLPGLMLYRCHVSYRPVGISQSFYFTFLLLFPSLFMQGIPYSIFSSLSHSRFPYSSLPRSTGRMKLTCILEEITGPPLLPVLMHIRDQLRPRDQRATRHNQSTRLSGPIHQRRAGD